MIRKKVLTATILLISGIFGGALADIPTVERDALIHFYNNTGGNKWSDSSEWLSEPGSECKWYGISCNEENTHIIKIDLAENNLNGMIPESIGDFIKLQKLDLRHNSLTDVIPEEMGNLADLEFLNLNSNELTGNIPSNIGNLFKLELLDLSSNQLTGNIPSELMNLENTGISDFGYLDLRWNALYTPDNDLKIFLRQRQVQGEDWEKSQAIAPAYLNAETPTTSSVVLTWPITNIPYDDTTGGYEISYSAKPYDSYTVLEKIFDKNVQTINVTGLAHSTEYLFRVRSFTDSHANNSNKVFSEYTEVYANTLFIPIITGQKELSTPEEKPLTITLDDLITEDHDNVFPRDFILSVQDGDNYSRSSYTVTPATDFNGTLRIPVTVSDGISDSNVYKLTVKVTEINDMPVADDLEITAFEDTDAIITLTGIDADNDKLIYKISALPTDGSLYQVTENMTRGDKISYIPSQVTNADHKVIYISEYNGNGSEYGNFGYMGNDGILDSPEAAVTVNVVPVNDAPEITGLDLDTAEFEDAGPAVLDYGNDAWVSDVDDINFNNGFLMAENTNNFAGDQLVICDNTAEPDEHNNGGGIYKDDYGVVYYNNMPFGFVDEENNGENGADLKIYFDVPLDTATQADADKIAVSALIRSVCFNNTDTNPNMKNRIITFKLNDGESTSSDSNVTVSFTNNIKRPHIVSTVPASFQEDADAELPITATFSESMNPLTITEDTFYVKYEISDIAESVKIIGTVTYDDNTGTFTPAEHLDYNTTYIAVVTADVEDTAGNAMKYDYFWSFTTGPEPDILSPKISSASPENGAESVPVNSLVKAVFSEPMTADTITSDTFLISNGTEDIAGRVSYNETAGVFVPAEVLAYSTSYTVTITTGAEDLAGNALEDDYIWSFTTCPEPDTTPPKVTSTTPEDGKTDADVDMVITAIFSEPVDSLTVTNASFHISDGENNIQGNVTYNGVSAIFSPVSELAYSTGYTAVITTAVKDLAGNPMENDYTWSFTTNFLPTVSSTSPEDGADNVPVDSYVIATFSEPVREDTVNSVTFSVNHGEESIEGKVSYTYPSATLIPAEDFAYDTVYTVVITSDVKDLQGNGLENDYIWSFTTEPKPDTTPPTVNSTSLENGEDNVPVDSAVIIVNFSEPMESETVTTATFSLTHETDNVAGTVTCNGTTGTFTPAEFLAYNSVYTVTITTGTKDLAGNPLEDDYTWSFTTEPNPDTTPPTVSSTRPKNGTESVSVDSAVIVTFSEPMISDTVTTATFSLTHGIGEMAGVVTYNGTTGTFTPDEILAYNTNYTAMITSDAKDLAGNPLENGYTWSFTTGPEPDTTPPTVSSTSPENGAESVSADSAVIVTFSEPMLSDTVTGATFSLSYGTDDVAGTVTYNGTTGTFTPDEILAYNTNYTAMITSDAKDLAGNPLENDYTWSFTTGPEPDTTPPTVSSTSPENGAEKVSADSAVIVTFSEPMISDTVTTATFSLSYGTDNVAGTVTYNGTTGTFTPAEVLAYNTNYTATITDAAKDLAGNPLENDYTWSFTTGPEPDTTPPTVSSTSPENDTEKVSADSAVIVTFSEPMISDTVTTATFSLSYGTDDVAGTDTYNGTTETLTSAEGRASNLNYTAM
ncbi:MAG: hypothetical protein GY749_48680, partial [Desulfobacteraceae bacterium]|nr:hypothetical protein [Desulfobacteraceae bacterium]